MVDLGRRRWWVRAEARRRAAPALVALWAAAVVAACASAPPAAPPPAREAEAAAPAAGMATAQPAATEAAPVEIGSLTLREGAPEVYLEVRASGPLVWTSFRDPEGRLVVELPNSVPGARVGNLAPATGLVSRVEVERERRANRPLTRLVVATRREVEHSVVGQGDALSVRLEPLAAASTVALAYEPLPDAEEAAGDVEDVERVEDEMAAGRLSSLLEDDVRQASAAAAEPDLEAEGYEAAAEEPAEPARPMTWSGSEEPAALAAGTPDRPFVAPPPTGAPAGRLDGVEVDSSGPAAVVRVEGDGQFAYSTFALADPHRFVIDLDGVINEAPAATVPVGGGGVERVRVAQFRTSPAPVSRVVFDLASPTVPRIERTERALIVRFNGNGPAYAAAAPAAVPAPAAVVSAPAPPPQEPEDEAVVISVETDEPEEVEVRVIERPAPRPDPPAPRPQGQPEPREPMPPAESDLDLYGGEAIEITTPPSPVSPVQSFAARTVGPTGSKEYVGELVSFTLRDADLVETLRSFAAISGLNMVIQPGVRGTVTVELNDVPWDQAFEQILRLHGLWYEVEGNIMRIAPTSVLQEEAATRQRLAQSRELSVPLTTVMRRLSYASAGAVQGLLRQAILSRRGSVIVDSRTNTLIIKELPEYMPTVIALIENLDIAEPLVMIEARIVETRKNFTRTLGIDWGFSGVSAPEFGNTTGIQFPNQGTVGGGVNLATGGENAFLDISLGNVLNTFNLDLALTAAENEGLVNILSAPKVQALNNQQASIQSGFQIPIQTVANNTVSVQFVNATLKLDVTPQVTAEGTVLMDINIQKRNPEFGLAIAGSPNAPISTKEASTRVLVRDGGTTVIGGIYEVSTNQGEDRVPGLANIPILGYLFKNRRREDTNNELLIFITPRVIKL